jgi:hypothetical protein
MVIGGEAHKMQQLSQDYFHCFVFNLKELGKLKGQEVHIILHDDTSIFQKLYVGYGTCFG